MKCKGAGSGSRKGATPDLAATENEKERNAAKSGRRRRTIMGTIRRDEHPRPDRVRQTWCTLNGKWDFAFDHKKAGTKEKWYTFYII